MNSNNRLQKLYTIFTPFLILAIGLLVGYHIGANGGLTPNQEAKPKAILTSISKPEEFNEVDFQQFWEVWDILDSSYLDPEKLDAEQQVYGAIAGMTSALGDPYTIYLPPSDQKRSSEDLAGAFYGVGIQLGYIDSILAVISPLKGSPAEKANVQPGDLILHIKDTTKDLDEDTSGMSLNDAVFKIRGERNVPVILTLKREAIDEPFEVSIPREEIVVPSVELTLLDDDGQKVAVISLSRFGGRTIEEWDDIVDQIVADSSIKAVVLDVRNNPGGFLEEAVEIASEFIESGTVITQEGRSENQDFTVSKKGRLTQMPVRVLVNKGSASASEIVAGALRDRREAQLIGEKTFGKGTVQDALELSNGAGLHVTVGRWLLPKGEWIHEEGIPVNVEVANNPDTEEDEVLQKALELL